MLTVAFALYFFLLAFAVSGGLIQAHRASQAHAELAQALHDKAMALDQRCDVLQRQLDAHDLWQRIDHLSHLVSACERQGQLDAEAARRLSGTTFELREEALRAADAG